MKKSYLLALMVLVSATAVSAADKQDNQTKTAAADQKASKKKPKKDKLICHSEPVTGSRTQVNRICHTAEEWDQIANQTRNNMDTLRESGSRGGEAAGTPGPG